MNQPLVKHLSFATTAACLALLISSWALGEEKYGLKLQVVPGQKWSFDVTSAMKQKGEITANGQPAQPIGTDANQRRKGTMEVLAVDEGKPSAVRVTFDADSSSSGNLNGQPVPQFTLGGKTITLRRGEGGTVTNDLQEQPEEQTLHELNHMLDPDTSVYPRQPVAVGDEWDGDSASLAKQFQLAADDTVSMKCKLLAIKDLDGRQVADINLTGKVVKHDQGFIETTTTLSGLSRVDLLTGQPLGVDVNGTMHTVGSKNIDGPNGQPVKIEVNADGDIESHYTVRLVGGGAPPEDHHSAPMHDNPLAPHSSSFSGAYKGNDLSMDLSGDPSHYTGSITLQDKKYPVVARSDGKTLTGSFESDGNQFDFSATLENGTLTLSSGGNTYTLKKAAVNPLAQPKPKNPLAQ